MTNERCRVERAQRSAPHAARLGAAVAASFLFSTAGWAQADSPAVGAVPAQECCVEITFPLGARVVALGGAVAADTGADMALVNPAGLAALRRTQLLVHFRPYLSDGRILGLAVVSPWRVGTFGVSYTLVDQGSLYLTGETGSDLGPSFRQVHALEGTFAAPLGRGVTAGLGYKLFVAVAPCGGDCEAGAPSGATQLLDFGVQYHPRWSPWVAAGAAVTNAGLPLQFVNYEQSDPPPTRWRGAVSYEFLHLLQADSTVVGRVSGQVEGGGSDGAIPSLGVEGVFGGVIAVRAGWRTGSGIDAGAALGVGIHIQRFTLSVARTVYLAPLDATSPPFYLTFSMPL